MAAAGGAAWPGRGGAAGAGSGGGAPASSWASWGVPDAVRSAVVHGAHALKTGFSDLMDAGDAALVDPSGGACWVLGSRYAAEDQESFAAAVDGVVWFSYRKGFHLPVPHGGPLTYDTGWGCVHRCGQMMLCTALRRHCVAPARELLLLFRDVEDAPYSLQRITSHGARCGRAVGQWLDPTTMALCLRAVVDAGAAAGHTGPLAVEVTDHATVDCDRLLRRADTSPVLLLVPVMLGMGPEMNSVYIDGIRACFRVPGCVGIVGGRVRHALYLVGCRGGTAAVLDPHRVQPAFVDEQSVGAVRPPRRNGVPIASLGPSCVAGFYAATPDDAVRLLGDLATVNAEQGGKYPIFNLHHSESSAARRVTQREEERAQEVQRTEGGYAVVA